jgi:chromosome segregation ATPase
MTEDDRMEFLRQSIESHDRQLGELAERMDITRAEIRELNQTVKDSLQRIGALDERVDRLAQTSQLNFDRLTLNMSRLAKAMTGLTDHVVHHQHRLEALERNQDPGQA